MSEPAPDQSFRVSVIAGGVVRVSWTPGSRITGTAAAAAMSRVDALNGDRYAPLLVDMAGVDTPTRQAREQFGRPSTASRIALVGATPVDRVRASIALVPAGRGFPVPTRFFTCEIAALDWLLNNGLGDSLDS